MKVAKITILVLAVLLVITSEGSVVQAKSRGKVRYSNRAPKRFEEF